jgi:hypothetical protein
MRGILPNRATRLSIKQTIGAVLILVLLVVLVIVLPQASCNIDRQWRCCELHWAMTMVTVDVREHLRAQGKTEATMIVWP